MARNSAKEYCNKHRKARGEDLSVVTDTARVFLITVLNDFNKPFTWRNSLLVKQEHDLCKIN